MLEIILITIAWRKGWRWKALLPTLVAFLTVFIVGGAVAAAGGEPTAILILCVFGELITLGIMASRAPSKATVSEKPKVESKPVVSDRVQPEHQKI